MSDHPKKKAHILRSFTDIGTGESFEAGDTPMLSAGAHANYEAAGLIGAPPAGAKAKPARKSTKPAKSRAKDAPIPATPKAAPPSGEAAPGA